MRKNQNTILFLVLGSAIALLFFCGSVSAKTDLSLAEADITFSKEGPFEGDLIRIFARVHNLGDTDVYGYVIFSDNKKELSGPQPISVKAGTYDDAFVDWKVASGNRNIEVKILDLNLPDEDLNNNKTVVKEYFIDKDTDEDGIGDKKDEDDDNDGLADKQELAAGTNPLNSDTDSDQAKDSIDAFPKDKTEWQDTDKDGLGDNKDLDDDNDGVFDFEEIYELGTNPLSQDTDDDGLLDKQELDKKTDPKKEDTDNDGVNDFKDAFPLDPAKTGASLMDSVAGLLNSKNSAYLIFGAPLALLVIFLLFKKKKRR